MPGDETLFGKSDLHVYRVADLNRVAFCFLNAANAVRMPSVLKSSVASWLGWQRWLQ